MNKKVFIKQDGTIPGHRIIEELERRGANNNYSKYSADKVNNGYYYYIYDEQIRMWYKCIAAPDSPLKGYTELFYNKETDNFFEKSQRMVSAEAKEALLEWEDIWLSSMLKNANNNLCLTIPEGYEAKIEDGKMIISKKKWQVGDTVYYPQIHGTNISIPHFWVRKSVFNNECTVVQELLFPTSEECQAFCDKLNNAIAPLLEERRKEVEG